MLAYGVAVRIISNDKYVFHLLRRDLKRKFKMAQDSTARISCSFSSSEEDNGNHGIEKQVNICEKVKHLESFERIRSQPFMQVLVYILVKFKVGCFDLR